MVDTKDLKSFASTACGFESRPRHTYLTFVKIYVINKPWNTLDMFDVGSMFVSIIFPRTQT